MKKLLIVVLILAAGKLFAQQDPLFSQYMFNKLAVNPGYAGSRETLSAVILNRWQWVGINGAPNTLSASIHSPLQNPHLGVGLTVYHDHLGPTVYQGALANFAYRILFPNGKLSFGLQAGVKYSGIDWNDPDLDPSNPGDPLMSGQEKNNVVPDANFGIYYYADNFYAGVSSKQLLQNQMAVVEVDGKSEFTKLLRHFYGIAGVAFPISENLVFRPSLLVKYVTQAPPQLDLNLSFLFGNSFWLGASYRTEKAVSFLTEIRITPSLTIGYSYDIWLNELRAYNKGSHELRIGFDLDKKNRMVTPRYF
jgi:type IX secretion system PorP/SprF family membrane protein